MTAPPTDFEAYGSEHPQLHAADAYPKCLRLAIEQRSGVFLEVGAGFGNSLRALLNDGVLHRFTSLIATDIARTATETIRSEMPTVHALQADALMLPLADDSVDVYYSNQVIEHVLNDACMATEAHRVLKPGGLAVIGSILKTPWAWYYYRCNGAWTIDPTHVREYKSINAYRKLFTDAGFHCEEIVVEPVAFPLHKVILVALVRCRIITAKRALAASKLTLLQALGRVHIRIPGYSYINAIITKTTAQPSA